MADKKIPYEKYEEDGKTAVVISRGICGVCWFLSHKQEFLLFDRNIVQLVLDGKNVEALEYAYGKMGEPVNYYDRDGADSLCVVMIETGKRFMVEDYDSSEYIITEDYLNLTA